MNSKRSVQTSRNILLSTLGKSVSPRITNDIEFERFNHHVLNFIVRGNMNKELTLATFFSGGFGTPEFALKYENIPFKNLVACEYDKFARESYIKNHGEPTLEMSHDIFNFDGKKYIGLVDVAHFSPECVDYSSAGKRKGEEGRSGGQYEKTIEIIEDMQPKIIVIENVANFAHQFKDVMDRVILELEEIGYQTSWHIMSADDYGTPQTRKRVFIVGFLGTGANFSTPLKNKTNVCIGDLMQTNVDDKYYLSQRALTGFKNKTEKQGGWALCLNLHLQVIKQLEL